MAAGICNMERLEDPMQLTPKIVTGNNRTFHRRWFRLSEVHLRTTLLSPITVHIPMSQFQMLCAFVRPLQTPRIRYPNNRRRPVKRQDEHWPADNFTERDPTDTRQDAGVGWSSVN
jgi:hypothetical protein